MIMAKRHIQPNINQYENHIINEIFAINIKPV